MDFYTRFAYKHFNQYSESLSLFFPDLQQDLKKAKIKMTVNEYICIAILTSFITFLLEIPLLSWIFGIFFKSPLFSLVTSFTVSIILSIIIFILFTKYPKTIIAERSKRIDSSLSFASLYLSTVAGSKLPLDKTFDIFSKYSRYGPVTQEIKSISNDIKAFGLDINSAIERGVQRTPSKKLKDLLWGILSTSSSGGDVGVYLREKSNSLMQDYRRQLEEFSKKLVLLMEIYITAVVLGAIFFIVLTAIFSGISGAASNIIILQTLIIFIFLPLISIFFIILVKISSPGGE